MNYHISRDGQQFGPYTLAEVQRYVADGNILLTDLACSEGMTQWVTVQQILATAQQQSPPSAPSYTQPPSQTPSYAQPSYPQPYQQPGPVAPQQVATGGGPMPPNLHWALLLVIGIFCGIFMMVWVFIEASFVKKLRPNSKAMTYYIAGIGGMILGYILIIAAASAGEQSLTAGGGLVCLGSVVAIILGHFAMKSSLEEYYNTVEPINLRLSGVMTFFFNIIYFQYHFNRIRNYKLTGVLQP